MLKCRDELLKVGWRQSSCGERCNNACKWIIDKNRMGTGKDDTYVMFDCTVCHNFVYFYLSNLPKD